MKKSTSQLITQDTTVSAPLGECYKDLYSQRLREGDLEAGIYLSECYEITGELSEARIHIENLLARNDLPIEIRARALMKKAAQQKDSPTIAWKTIKQAELDGLSDLVRGKLHNQRGRILKELKKYDRAIIEYTAAAYYFELCVAPELIGLAHNNLASIYRYKGLFQDAHDAVDKAITLWQSYYSLPHALDQKALIYIDEKRYLEAFALASDALVRIEDQHRWRAEFLATLSKAQAGLSLYVESHLSIETALDICDYLSDENLRLKILSARKVSCEIMHQQSVKNCLELALELSGNRMRPAAKLLGINHSAARKSWTAHCLPKI